ncbi:MAG TPA: phosphatase PAP2 family protein [Mariprofundaceae bacterium]|nr:phosphatase PAP2 family protein [Mariprofundaceae bacterium]
MPGVVAKEKHQLITYLYWVFWISVAFFSVYPSANWLTDHRDELFQLYLPFELSIPFVPQFIWVYLSMYLLFLMPAFVLAPTDMPRLGKQLIAGTLISGVLFLLLPASLGFTRALPDTAPYDSIFSTIFSIDRPHNLVPSLHVVFSSCIMLAIAERSRGWISGLLMLWLAAIIGSTLLVHQHHVLDVASGLALTIILRAYYRGGPCSDE